MRAKLASTYGWTHEYITGLPISVFMDYWLAITPIEARTMLNDLNIVSFPHIAKKTDKQKFLTELKSMSNKPVKTDNNRLKSIGDIYQHLARKLNGQN